MGSSPTNSSAAAAPASPSHDGPELQTCAGVGWVTFDHSDGTIQASGGDLGYRMPLLRCFGSSASQQLASGRRTSAGDSEHSSAATSLAPTSRGAGDNGLHEVSDDTRMVVCAGQLSMLMPLSRAGADRGSTAGTDAVTGAGSCSGSTWVSHNLWDRCRLRCSGISVRLDEVERSEVAKGRPQPRPTVDDDDGEELPDTSLWEFAEDLAKTSARGVESVVRRAGTILADTGTAAHEAGPQQFVRNTANTAGKIFARAAKIARRSVEQVGSIADLRQRPDRGGGDSG
mmetsp:Transcript_87500/g.245702  ORF Transcript_87500/g.245702 Transcript_87500/m.245702 type:complete len:286 (+) Transcript_87500:84-941(+)|eukprot:CAMPEP_0117526934 /NCGR_PEP_ID=MMETSP0784-20121206/36540_1 /TAXON_ID=39447 /ORGANISM="" /LENGTH=285 /DNA_ID=CAMNT_0005323175 /DNA_START=72 /DNA_END=929 /DNA_ORIENTATION=+